MIIKLLIDGGDMKPGPTIAQKIGPLGINMGKVISDINSSTKNFKGMKVPVELDVNPKTKTFSVNVFSPPVAELLKKSAGTEKAAGDHKKLKAGNLSIEEIISISKTKFPNMLSKNLKSTVMTVIGSCQSLGILVENKEAKETAQDVKAGNYDKEIAQEKTETSQEKLELLKKYFEDLHKKQEEAIKKAEAEKAAQEAEKAAASVQAAPAAGKTSGAATPAAAAAAPTAAPAKADAKKPAAKK